MLRASGHGFRIWILGFRLSGLGFRSWDRRVIGVLRYRVGPAGGDRRRLSERRDGDRDDLLDLRRVRPAQGGCYTVSICCLPALFLGGGIQGKGHIPRVVYYQRILQ